MSTSRSVFNINGLRNSKIKYFFCVRTCLTASHDYLLRVKKLPSFSIAKLQRLSVTRNTQK